MGGRVLKRGALGLQPQAPPFHSEIVGTMVRPRLVWPSSLIYPVYHLTFAPAYLPCSPCSSPDTYLTYVASLI